MTNTEPAELAAASVQRILDRFFELRNTFEGGLAEVAMALQLQHDQLPHRDGADPAAAERAIAAVNAAIQAVWPDVPGDLLLRGPGGAGRGRLTVKEFNSLVTPGGPGALTHAKLARRMAGSSDTTPAPRAAPDRSLRLNQVTVPTSDLARSIAFYSGLGLKLIVRDDSVGYARLLFPDGGSTFSLHVADGPIARSGVVIYFECDDLDDRVARLCSAGYQFLWMPVDQTWLWREAMLEDPDGQQICLFHAGVNRQYPPWRLDDAAE